MSEIQWFGKLLDRHIAPELSSLSSCDVPDVPEVPNYFGSFYVNNVLVAEFDDKPRALGFMFIRRLVQATRDYRAAKEAIQEFTQAKQCSNDAVTLYLRALNCFERSVLDTDRAVALCHAIAQCADPSIAPIFEPGQHSPEERLRGLSNALKHFDGTVVRGQIPTHATPVWIVTDGLRGIEMQKGGVQVVHTLRFEELAAILRELEGNAKFMAEEVYRLALERRKEMQSTPKPGHRA